MLVDVCMLQSPVKPKANSTLLSMKRTNLIEYIRVLEHNYNVAVSFNEQQARNIETMIRNGDIQPKWISVEERLPEKNTLVLCIGAKGGMFLGEFCFQFDDSVYFSVPNARKGRYAKYWMPLPKPPEEVPDENA